MASFGSASLLRAPSTASAVGLVLANLIPLVGVVWFDWSLFGVMWLYWAENGVIGLFALLRILTAGEGHGQKLFLAPFFVVHFGMFWLVHGLFVVSLFGLGADTADPEAALWDSAQAFSFEGIAALLLSHGASFVMNYLVNGERRVATAGGEMFKPYGRVVLLHVVILAGGFLIQGTGASVLALALFIGLKTAFDLGVHLVGHHYRYKKLKLEAPDPERTTLRLDAVPDRLGDEAEAEPLVLSTSDDGAPRRR